MENFVRKVREAMGISQTEFGRLIGRSMQSVRNYENASTLTPEVIKEVVRVATDAGLGDLAMEIARKYQVSRVFEPAETIITTPHPERQAAGKAPGKNARWHALLDDVLESGRQDAITAVQHNLVVFGAYVHAKGPNTRKKSG